MTGILISRSSFRDKQFPLHSHESYSISLVLEGSHRFVTKKESVTISKGMVRVIHPLEMHAIELSSWEQINISIAPRYLERLAQNMGKPTLPFFDNIIPDEKIAALVMRIGKAHDKGDTASVHQMIDALLHSMLETCLPAPKAEPDAETIKSEMKQARDYIDTHAHSYTIDLEEIARAAQMSKYHFIRVFKQTFGRTPHQHLQNTRIDCVRKRLAEHVSLAEAAQACGFYDQSHMIKTYKKYYGHTPSQAHSPRAQCLTSDTAFSDD